MKVLPRESQARPATKAEPFDSVRCSGSPTCSRNRRRHAARCQRVYLRRVRLRRVRLCLRVRLRSRRREEEEEREGGTGGGAGGSGGGEAGEGGGSGGDGAETAKSPRSTWLRKAAVLVFVLNYIVRQKPQATTANLTAALTAAVAEVKLQQAFSLQTEWDWLDSSSAKTSC